MKFIRLLVLPVLMSVPILIISCKKTTQIGVNVLPAIDIVNAVSTDTFTVLTQEEAEFPVPTSGLTNYLLGSMKDPNLWYILCIHIYAGSIAAWRYFWRFNKS